MTNKAPQEPLPIMGPIAGSLFAGASGLVAGAVGASLALAVTAIGSADFWSWLGAVLGAPFFLALMALLLGFFPAWAYAYMFHWFAKRMNLRSAFDFAAPGAVFGFVFGAGFYLLNFQGNDPIGVFWDEVRQGPFWLFAAGAGIPGGIASALVLRRLTRVLV